MDVLSPPQRGLNTQSRLVLFRKERNERKGKTERKEKKKKKKNITRDLFSRFKSI